MILTDNPIKLGVFKPLMLVALLALVGACGDNGQDDTSATETEAPADTAMTEQVAPATTAEADKSAASEPTPAGGSDAAAASTDSGGETHVVNARATSFDPVVLKIEPGDTVSWTNMSGHNVHFEAGNIPEGAEPWQTALGNDVNRTFNKEGLYLYKCDPHFSMGMVGALIVGTPDNVAQVEDNAKGMYKRALAKAMKEIE